MSCGKPDHFDYGPQPDVCFKDNNVHARKMNNLSKFNQSSSDISNGVSTKITERKHLSRRLTRNEVAQHALAPHIHYGYPRIDSFVDGLQSMFRLHNETVNIWTHIFGFICTIGFLSLTGLEYQNYHIMDSVMLTVFAVCCALCFTGSILFHTFKCYSYEIYKLVVMLDYLGIFVMIYGSFFSGLYFEFYCQSTERTVYQVGITILVITGVIFSFSPKFDDDRYMHYRLGIFFGVGAFAVIPMMSVAATEGVGRVAKWFVLLLLYSGGAVFYVTKFPESRFPGRFQIWFSSHQLWHGMVVAAALWQYYSLKHLHVEKSMRGCKVVDDGLLMLLSSYW
ncbi:hypothetical protein SARC_08878 [Sphaeroforma arctica JP610]|uniref:Uncharacterized protein n=1 Tax=Sphaeroforma arctica JP610 TaxID=667725 RepID=A0A0L0FQ99_9EUKA|nr:hypothetical protein SARC_08878 [Sphaeroforma arctica JP610]KNC78706.1 hypothetical protein SARC_08878 [Sphaeroforma arctica JP610]|eukprot:XP_014152608.1 hypothetical protein SARC_08878 [Sphaeroforma arctica JP610]